MANAYGVETPETLEGWYVLYDIYALDWVTWRALEPADRDEIAVDAAGWLASAAGCDQGGSALYSVLTQKGDLMFTHYRETPEALNRVELSLRQRRLFDFLVPTRSYLAVVELSLDELAEATRRKLTEQGILPGPDEYEEYFETEMRKQRRRAEGQLFGNVPEHRCICVYPMNRRRGEQVNWYTLTVEERRDLMRSHARIGQKYQDQVTQIIGGSIGLDDWEWVVSLHANDALVFKKLLYEMRFDPAGALYAEFGPLYIGIHAQPDQLPALLAGRLPPETPGT